jgi:hypothetical protein
MKTLRSFLPAVVVIAAGGIWYLQASHTGKRLQLELQSRRAPDARKSSESSASSNGADDERSSLTRELAQVGAELQREAEAAATAEKHAAELRGKIPAAKPDEAIVSYGRIADMGAETGQAMRQVIGTHKKQKLDGEAGEALGNAFMKIMAWMPEIAGLEESPAEIASFQAAMLRQVFEFDEAKTRQAEETFRRHFAAMKANGLTAAHASAPQWRERRSEALTQLLWQLRPLLPPDFQENSLAQLVNIGAGFETNGKTEVSPKTGQGTSSITMTLPAWPRLPWAPPAGDQ